MWGKKKTTKFLKQDPSIIVNKIRIQSLYLTASSRYNHVSNSTIYVYSLTENHCILIWKVNYTHNTTNIWLLFWDFIINVKHYTKSYFENHIHFITVVIFFYKNSLDAGIQDSSTSISIVVKFEEMSHEDDESDKRI